MALGRILDICPGCKRRGVRHAGHGLCARCVSRRRRANETPEARRKELETSAAWKRRNPGYDLRYNSQETMFLPGDIEVKCWYCQIEMVTPDGTGLCGFCKIEVPAWEKLMAYKFPDTDQGWETYFGLLDNTQLLELHEKMNLEMIRRTGIVVEALVRRNEELYGSTPPAHHRKAPPAQTQLFARTG